MEIKHNASEKPQLDAPVPSGHSANRRIGRFSHKECLIFSVILNIILIVVLIVKGLVSPSPCPLSCPPGWLHYEGICYYFSNEERNWTSSQDFCSSYNASLATIENEEKDFVMRYREKVPYWIGLTRLLGQPWKWQNGQIARLKVLGEGDNCAYLSAEAQASVSRCSTEHLWICSKLSNLTGTG
ncbi:C-type lectin domain family 2 member D-like [Heteronotia binoei]|uniref:C-type lectin domain family 2 member D-like n=1 Tax=Heteronotia binoei TaxID=13085 RepID=UPI00292E7F41|nr:C-type lectin domain family 2 member D-like [Heteronotia binoei]XP_060094224.1 C-type lectin domain family 2 member D-like [Heteronotia binoei]